MWPKTFSLIFLQTNAIDEEIEEELCGEKRARDEYCSYSSLWSESHRWHKNDPSKLSVPATTIAWIGTEMNFSPERMSSRKDGFMQWVTTEQDREGTYSSSVDRRVICFLVDTETSENVFSSSRICTQTGKRVYQWVTMADHL